MQAVSRTVSGSSFWRFHRWMYMRAYVHTYAHIRIVVPLNENSCGTVWVPIIKLNWDGLPIRLASFYEYIYIYVIYIYIRIYIYVYVCLIIVDSVTLKSSLIIVDSHCCWFSLLLILNMNPNIDIFEDCSKPLVVPLDWFVNRVPSSWMISKITPRNNHQPTITCQLSGLVNVYSLRTGK